MSERTLEQSLALAGEIRSMGVEARKRFLEDAEEILLLADEVLRLRDREARIKPIFLRYDEIAEPFAEAAKIGQSRVGALAAGIADLQSNVLRLQKENERLTARISVW